MESTCFGVSLTSRFLGFPFASSRALFQKMRDARRESTDSMRGTSSRCALFPAAGLSLARNRHAPWQKILRQPLIQLARWGQKSWISVTMKLFRSTITATSSTAAPLLGLLVLCSTIIFVSADDDLCTSEETNTFTAVVDLHAGELGTYVRAAYLLVRNSTSCPRLHICAYRTVTLSYSLLHQGYFTFKECPGKVSPTLGLELGQTYTFIQEDISNWCVMRAAVYLEISS
jgi:hypothetical protein